MEPCAGLLLEAGSLLELAVPVYGLDDAPISWRKALVSFQTEKM